MNQRPKHHIQRDIALVSLFAGLAVFLVWTAFYQLTPLTSRRLWLAFGAAAGAAGVISVFGIRVLNRAFYAEPRTTIISSISAALIITFFIVISSSFRFPALYANHTLEISPLPDENGVSRPLTLTLFSGTFPTMQGDQTIEFSFAQFELEGDWTRSEAGLTAEASDASLRWRGKVGTKATIEFAADASRGSALLIWDGEPMEIGLFRDDPEQADNSLNRLSFEKNFAPPNRLVPTIAIGFLLWFGIAVLITLVVTTETRRFPIVFTFIACAFFISVRIVEFARVDEPLRMIDSAGYLEISRFSVREILMGKAYCYPEIPGYCQSRPFLIPLFFKIFGQDIRVITAVSLAISLSVWIFAAISAAQIFSNHWIKKAALVCLLGLGASSIVTRWEVNIFSESLSISVGVFFIGLWILIFKTRSDQAGFGVPEIFFFLAAAALVFTRDTNVVLIWIAALLIGCIALSSATLRKKSRIVAVILALLAITAGHATGDRWKFSYFNVLFMRILRDPNATAYFIDRGMPMVQGIDALIGVEHSQGNERFQSESFELLRAWVAENGLKTYWGYLLTNPVQIFREPFHEGYLPVAFGGLEYRYAASGYRPILPEQLTDFFGFRVPFWLFVLILVAGLTKAVRNREWSGMSLIFAWMSLGAVFAAMVYALDSYDFVRQSTQFIIQQKICTWIVFFYLLDTFPSNHHSDTGKL